MDERLNPEQKRLLLSIARTALELQLHDETETLRMPDEGFLHQVRGVFSTLKVAGQLRGCIGQIEAEHPLYRVVPEMTVAAATRDPRFPPLSLQELEVTAISLSILSPPQLISDVSMIEVGRHGLVISQGSRRGVLLPQVPVEWNWDLIEFLENTCRKAGLPPDAYRDANTTIAIFSTDSFEE